MTTSTTTTLQELKPSQIKPHKANPRRDVGDVDELAASITEKGIVEPLIVAPNGTGDTYTLLAGHRRLAAAKVAKSKTVPCIVREDLAADPKGQLELMLVENLQRTDLTAVEEAQAYQMLLTFPGYTQARIAKATGRSIATVRGRLKLAGLPKASLEKIHAGQISLGEADALVEFAGDKAAFARLERSAGNPAEFGRNLQDLRNQGKATRARERLEKQLADAGVRIIQAPSLYQAGPRRLYHDEEIEAHRECPGFAAYVQVNSYNGTALACYVCDQPELHRSAEAPSRADDEASAAERKAAEERLAADAVVRRTWIRDHVFREPSDGLALDMLRAHTIDQIVEYGLGGTFVNFLLGVPADVEDDDADAARASAITELSLQQLAVLLDVIDHEDAEETLLRPYGWAARYRTPEWCERLTTLYGYTWTEHEQQLVDAAAAASAEVATDDGVDD